VTSLWAKRQASRDGFLVELADRLRAAREASGMTMREAAARIQVTPRQVGRWECAEVSPQIYYLPRLAELYGVPIAELVPGSSCS